MTVHINKDVQKKFYGLKSGDSYWDQIFLLYIYNKGAAQIREGYII